MNRPKDEYGGFLSLELNEGQEYFEPYKDHLRRYNSVKAAIFDLIHVLRIHKIIIPYYYCPTTTDAIRSMGLDVSFYHIAPDLLPEELPDEADSAVILVDYFGVISDEIKKLTDRFQKAVVILDNAHSFFSEPLMRDRLYQVYSAKKFFGIPDGAYLIGKELIPENKAMGHSYEYADYLLLAYESGTNAAYQKKKQADQTIAESPGNMSRLALGLLRNVDYRSVSEKRESNYLALHQKLEQINELALPDKCAGYLYPLLLPEAGSSLKLQLVSNRIYVPTLWSGDDLLRNGNQFELSISENGVFLPIDQRYSPDDMAYISGCIDSILQ